MAYFANGTEGEIYQETFCCKCKNFRDKKDDRGYGCPIWDLHFLYNRDKSKRKILNFLIPDWKITDKGASPQECSMFYHK